MSILKHTALDIAILTASHLFDAPEQKNVDDTIQVSFMNNYVFFADSFINGQTGLVIITFVLTGIKPVDFIGQLPVNERKLY